MVDVFLRDRRRSTVERVSVGSLGAETDFGGTSPAISADGRFVAFASDATNLVTGDTNATMDVFVRNRGKNLTERVSISSGGI